MYSVQLSADARAFFEDADSKLQRKLDRCFDQLKLDPRHHNNIKPLKGILSGYFRYRIGDWRVLYGIDDALKRVVVTDIAHRREVY